MRRLVTAGLCLMLVLFSGCSGKPRPEQDFYQAGNGIKMVSRVQGDDIEFYSHGTWQKRFWAGVNLGATTPGHHPGEFSPTYQDYRRWFTDIEELGAKVVRVYTILPPDFYRALADHNRTAKNKLWLIQGIWSPEEELISQKNAFLPSITRKFHREISLAVRAVYGQGVISPSPGKASGKFIVNVAPYLLGWMVGSEWYPYMVKETDRLNPGKSAFHGKYFSTVPGASPFEAWLAACLEELARTETVMGWQHPIAFVNWVTTDPLPHPDEPLEQEDLATVDPQHIRPTGEWLAGYYAAYHVYPYYPDSLRFQQDYQKYINQYGRPDPFEGYLRQLKQHHAGIPLVIAEFGVPSSRGMAHRGPLGRNQGMHTEKEQGEMDVAMFKAIKNVGAAGGILFEWHDEWFKFTWNTWDLEIPGDRRPMWMNRLTNEENFGLLAVEPGEKMRVVLDGRGNDWDEIDDLYEHRFDDRSKIMITNDEGYLYISLFKPGGWDWNKDDLYIGFDTLPGGNRFASGIPARFDQGLEFLLKISDKDHATLEVASAYDQHTYLYGQQKKMIPWKEEWSREENGIFLPWKLCLSRELFLPVSQQRIPFEDIEVGRLRHGNTDPESEEYDSLADFYAGPELLEIRIPWMMLGFTDPSSHQVWAYPYRSRLPYFTSTTSPGLNLQVLQVNQAERPTIRVEPPVSYNWCNWDHPTSHERKKQSYHIVKSYLGGLYRNQ